MTVVLGTAGHIDHGKTTLLRALTGIDADRLPEERRRGLTVDVGYAHHSPDGGPEIDFVDVPGHDRLVGNMLVGAGEIDACLLVVAADEGPRAQTREHLGLLDAIGIRDGIVAVSRVDLVEPDRVAAVIEEVRALIRPTSLAGAAVIPVSAVRGDGLDELNQGLAALRDRVGPLATRPLLPVGPWLTIDRAFTVRGRGLVVTGSARGERIALGASLIAQPGDVRVRVRGIQVHDRAVDRGPDGGRVALNLAGVGPGGLRRGHVITAGSATASGSTRADSVGAAPAASSMLSVAVTDRLLVALRRPASLSGSTDEGAWPPHDGLEARLHIGTDQAAARVGRSGRDAILLPDGQALAILHLDRPVATAVGERFVLRRPRPAALLAGGLVLDLSPPRGRSRRRQTPGTVTTLVTAVADGDADAVARAALQLHGLRIGAGAAAMAADVEQLARSTAIEAVRTHHDSHPELAGLPLPAVRAATGSAIRRAVTATEPQANAAAATIIDALLRSGALEREGELVRLPGHRPPPPDPARAAAMDRLVTALDTASPPSLSAAARVAGCTTDGIRELERAGRIVVVEDDLAWSAAAYGALSAKALALAAASPLTPAALRDATGTSRKYVMALLEDMDRRGILRRTHEGHVPGPRKVME